MEYLFFLLCNIYYLMACIYSLTAQRKEILIKSDNFTFTIRTSQAILFPQKFVRIYLGSFVSASGLFFSICDLSVYYRKCSSSSPWHELMFHCTITED